MQSTDKIILREFKKEDAPRVTQLCNNINIFNNVKDTFPYPYKLNDAEYFINNCVKQNPTTTFAIDMDGELTGTVGLEVQTDIYRLSAELGYWIGEPYWGLGIATEAVKLITDYGFNKLNLIRIYSGVYDFNEASKRVLEKAGYKLESIARKAIIKNGNIYDGYRFALTI